MKSFCILLFSGLLINRVSGQDDKIQADRPGETQTPEITSKGYLQAETGFQKEQISKDDHLYFHPQVIIKYGLHNRFELSVALTDETQKSQSIKDTFYGMKPIEIGFKIKLLEEKGLMPTTTLLTHVGIPGFSSKDFKAEHAFPKIRLLFENTLTKKLKLTYNLGPEWDGTETKPEWFYSIASEREIGNKWAAFFETFGRIQEEKRPKHYIDGGLAFFPTSNIKFDLSVGAGISNEASDYFVSTGISFRLKP